MNTKQLIVFLLVALFAVAAVSAQIDEQADNKLTDFLKAILKQQKASKFQEEADLVFSPALVKRLLHTPAYYILTDEELADKSFWKKALKVVGEIGKAAIKDYVNKNWDEIPEEEADIKLGKLFKAVLPYLKEGAKQYINNNWDAEEMADKKFSEIIKSVLPYIKAGVKSYIANNWDEEADKGFWSSVWKVVKGGVKDYVNKNWEQEMEMSDKFFSKVWKVVKDIGKGAIKSYVNQNFGVSADAQKFKLGNLWKKALPYIKSGVKEYLNKNWEQEVEMSDKIKFGKIFKKALNVAKGLGKAYITSQFGIPLEDLPQSDKFFKKMWSVVRTELKNAGKNYLKNLLSKKAAFAEEADAELKFKDILRKALPYLKEGAKQYINNNWDAEEAADKIDFEKLFRIALPYLRRQVE